MLVQHKNTELEVGRKSGRHEGSNNQMTWLVTIVFDPEMIAETFELGHWLHHNHHYHHYHHHHHHHKTSMSGHQLI